MNRQRLLAILGLILVMGVVAAAGRHEKTQSVPVSSGQIHERLIARATIEPVAGTAEIKAQIDGKIGQVYVREGTHVHAGQLLATITNGGLEAELHRLESEHRAATATTQAVREGARPEERAVVRAQIEEARHELALAQDRWDRQRRLTPGETTSEQARTEARQALAMATAREHEMEARQRLADAGGRDAEVQAAEARARAADAAIAQLRDRLGYARVTAPVSGVILARHVDPGDTVEATAVSTPLFELADPTHLELRAEVEEDGAMRVRPGMAITLHTPGSNEIIGRGKIVRTAKRLGARTIDVIDSRLRADGSVRSIWCSLDPEAGKNLDLAIGQRLEVAISLPPVAVRAMVPRGAISVQGGTAHVRQPGLIGSREIPVQLGHADAESVEVEGIEPGTSVLVSP